MAVEIWANDASATVTSGGTDAPSAGTSESWTLSGSTLPAVSSSASPPTQCYVCDPAAESEKILVTNVSGTSATVTRGADGTTPVAHSAGFTIVQVLAHASYVGLQTRWANVLDPQFAGGADPTGGADSTAAIQAALLSFGTLAGWNPALGGVAYLPAGIYATSKPLVIPAGVILAGAGWGTVIALATGSNCDVVQFATYDSSAQAAILGVSASGIANAFWSGVTNLQVHGDALSTTTAGYHHGINITLNPLNSAASGDPDFDPHPLVRDVWIKACTGDGLYHTGRSGALFERIWSAYHNGNGYTLSYDTTLLNCLAEGTNCGIYTSHSSVVSAGCKSYNNKDYTWVSGTSYSPGNVAVYSATMYFCILAVSGSTAPASDTAHWTALSATSPQAAGYGVYWDTGCGEQNWSALNGEENSKGDFYFKGPFTAGAMTVAGSSSGVNFNNGQADYNSANPDDYACATFDGCSGVTMILDSSTQTGGSAVVCTTLNGAANNTLIASTDGTEAKAFSGAFNGTAVVNGVPAASKTVTKTTSYTLTASDFIVLADGTLTVTLPDATVRAGQQYIVVNSTGAGAVTMGAAGSQTIAGLPAGDWALFSQGQSFWLASDGANWQFIAANGVYLYLDVFGPLNMQGNSISNASGLGVTGDANIDGVAHLEGGSDTSGTATESAPSFTTATAQQLDTVQDAQLYVCCGTAVAATIAFGPTSTPAYTLVNNKTLAAGQVVSFKVPKGWYVKVTCATMADLSFIQVTC